MPNIGHELDDGYRNLLETSPIHDPEFLQIGSSNEMIQDFPFDNSLGTNWDRYCSGQLMREWAHVHQCFNTGGKCCAKGKDGNPSIGVNWNKGEDKPHGICGNCYNGRAKPIKP